MTIQWLGHSCFLITNNSGVRLLTDPFDDTVGYELPRVECDVVASSHDHFDHNHFQCIPGEYVKLTEAGETTVCGIPVKGIPTYHDDQKGALRGNNIIYNFNIDGIQLCHCGDIGHQLSDETIQAIGHVDILMLPVGSVYTVDGKGAKKIVDALKPHIVIPMHYRTEDCKLDVESNAEFLEAMKDWKTEQAGNKITLSGDLGEKRMILMQYK